MATKTPSGNAEQNLDLLVLRCGQEGPLARTPTPWKAPVVGALVASKSCSCPESQNVILFDIEVFAEKDLESRGTS